MQLDGHIKLCLATIIWVLTSFAGPQAVATTIDTPESAALGNLASVMGMYGLMHEHRLPTTWDQIKEIYDIEYFNQRLIGRQSYPLQDHYQFITQPLPLIKNDEGQVLLIRTVPLGDRKQDPSKPPQLRRYLIYMQKTGDIVSIGMSEEDVQAMLKKASVTITPKPGLPEVEYDTLPLDHTQPAEGTTKSRVTLSKNSPEFTGEITTQVKQPKVIETTKSTLSLLSSSKYSLLIWSLVAIAATAGAAWLLLRKKK